MLNEYYDLTMTISPPPPMPSMHRLWKEVQTKFEAMLEDAESGYVRPDEISKWIDVIHILLKTDRRVLLQDGFPSRYDKLIEKLCEIVDSEADDINSFSDDDAAAHEADRFSEIASVLEEIERDFPHLEDELRRATREAERQSKRLKEDYGNSRSDDTPTWAKQRSANSLEAIDLERLFSDL